MLKRTILLSSILLASYINATNVHDFINTNKYDQTGGYFTPRELARIADLPDSFVLPENRSEAAAVIGDGVVCSVFSHVVERIAKHLKNKQKEIIDDKN